MNFFTADTHFFHENIITVCNRPFKSVEEMNETIVQRWNGVVSKGDLVYHLGDVAWWKAAWKEEIPKLIKRLNGQIYLIKGNHDKMIATKHKDLFTAIKKLHRIKIAEQTVVLCHFAMRVWHRSHHNSWHLYGHSHGELPGQGKSFDVGMDCSDFTPIPETRIISIMNTLPDNINYCWEEDGE